MTFIKTETVTDCPVCGSKKNVFWSTASDLLMQVSNQSFEYSRCNECSSLYMSLRPIEQDIEVFYSSNYHPYNHSNESKSSVELNIWSRCKLKLKAIVRAFVNSKVGCVLKGYLYFDITKYYNQLDHQKVFVDFGCGAGKTLDKLRLQGSRTVGVDFSPVAVATIKKNNHEAYLVDDFWVNFLDESADFVRMNHVVEHLYQPHNVLNKLAKKIKSKGVLHIAVPNPDGISSLVFKNNWHGLDCPRHVILYPPNTLKQVLEKQGFKNFKVIHETITKDFVRSIGYWLASKGYCNLEKVNDLMHIKWLAVIFWIPAKFAAIAGRADRFHIVCYKK